MKTISGIPHYELELSKSKQVQIKIGAFNLIARALEMPDLTAAGYKSVEELTRKTISHAKLEIEREIARLEKKYPL